MNNDANTHFMNFNKVFGFIAIVVAFISMPANCAENTYKREQTEKYLRTDSSIATPSPFRLAIQRSDYVVKKEQVSKITPDNKSPVAVSLSPMIERHAKSQRLDPALIHAVIRAESHYRVDVVSPKGAIGLMQVMPATGKRFGVYDLEHPDQNLKAGTTYFRYLLDRYNNVPLALAAYNAGEGAVSRFGNTIPPYPETQGYVQEVLRSYSRTALPEYPLPRVYLDGLQFVESSTHNPYRLINSSVGSGYAKSVK